MRFVFFILLGLSVSALAQTVTSQDPAPDQSLQQKEVRVPRSEKSVESTTICDPKQKTQMPETFF